MTITLHGIEVTAAERDAISRKYDGRACGRQQVEDTLHELRQPKPRQRSIQQLEGVVRWAKASLKTANPDDLGYYRKVLANAQRTLRRRAAKGETK